jgi:hypothetical protein
VRDAPSDVLTGDVFAGELAPVEAPPRRRPGPALVRQALGTGLVAGTLPAAAVFAIYFAFNHHLAMPWIRIASWVAVYGPVVGVLLACSVQVLVLGFDRAGAVVPPLRVIANPVSAGCLGGALAGVLPGAVGVVVFGSYHGPFVGTSLIACGVIAGAVMVAAPLARRARRARIHAAGGRERPGGDRGVIAAATVIATLILVAVAVVIAPILVDGAFAEARGALATRGAAVGALVGAIGGGVVGVFIGLVIALGRSLRLPR